MGQGGCEQLTTVVGGGGHRHVKRVAGGVIMEDMAHCGHVDVVAEVPVHEVAVDVYVV